MANHYWTSSNKIRRQLEQLQKVFNRHGSFELNNLAEQRLLDVLTHMHENCYSSTSRIIKQDEVATFLPYFYKASLLERLTTLSDDKLGRLPDILDGYFYTSLPQVLYRSFFVFFVESFKI